MDATDNTGKALGPELAAAAPRAWPCKRIGITSADGLVADLLWYLPLYIWSLAVSIALLRKPVAG
jgi:hypothetical protein